MKKKFSSQQGQAPNFYNSGQAVLVVVLVMVVALTIGLAISGRSVTDIKMSAQMEESQRAFSAAEAGIETALLSGAGGSGMAGNASYNVKVSDTDKTEFVFPDKIPADEPYQIWLVKWDDLNTKVYDKDGIKIVWGNQNSNWANDNNTPAIVITIVYKDGNEYKFGKYALDPRTDRNNHFCLSNGNNCSGVSNWNTNGETINGKTPKTLQFSADIDLSNFRGLGKTLQLLRMKLLYNNNGQLLGVKALDSGELPSQGKVIESTGTAGETTREVNVLELGPSLPTAFDFSIFSEEDIIHD